MTIAQEFESRFPELGEKNRILTYIISKNSLFNQLTLPNDFTQANCLDAAKIKKTRLAVKKFLKEAIMQIYPNEMHRFARTDSGYCDSLNRWLNDSDNHKYSQLERRPSQENKNAPIGWADICSALEITKKEAIDEFLFHIFEKDGYGLHLRNPIEAAAYHSIKHKKNSIDLRELAKRIEDATEAAKNFTWDTDTSSYTVEDLIMPHMEDNSGDTLANWAALNPEYFSLYHTGAIRQVFHWFEDFKEQILSEWRDKNIQEGRKQYEQINNEDSWINEIGTERQLKAKKNSVEERKEREARVYENIVLENEKIRTAFFEFIEKKLPNQILDVSSYQNAMQKFFIENLSLPLIENSKNISRNAFIFTYCIYGIIADNYTLGESFFSSEYSTIITDINEVLNTARLAPLINSDNYKCPRFDWIIQRYFQIYKPQKARSELYKLLTGVEIDVQ